MGHRPLRPVDGPHQVAVAHVRRFVFLAQAVGGELPDRLQEAIALLGPVAPCLGQNQGLVHQAGQQVEHLVRRHRVARAHGLGRLERPAPGEDREAAQERPRIGLE